jgi:hypothetical protein
VKRAIALVIAMFGLSEVPIAHAEQSQRFTVIDRTMLCTTGFAGGAPDRIRTVTASVSAQRGSGTAQFDPSVFLNTGATTALVRVYTQEAPGVTPDVRIHRRSCTQLKTRLRLLGVERSAPPVDFSAGCRIFEAPARILVRLRVVLEAPALWTVYRRQYLRARGKAVEAFLIVRTHPGRKPVAFASFARDGSARFFRAPRCTE